VIWLEEGRVRADGPVDTVMDAFAGVDAAPALFPEAALG
jgi:hypothetical protein